MYKKQIINTIIKSHIYFNQIKYYNVSKMKFFAFNFIRDYFFNDYILFSFICVFIIIIIIIIS